MKITYPLNFKKINSKIIIFTLLFSFFIAGKTYASEHKPCFITTAYYSPIEGQKYYYNGSYEKEIKMNGEGKHTASGREPYYGALAGPSKFPFGTKIYLEGYGIGSIEDRGSDIVQKGERGDICDRLDIWMGYGDEGLWRALKWGRNVKIYGEIVSNLNEINLEFGKDIITPYKDLIINPEKSSDEEVKQLQELLKQLGIYKGNIDGKYENIKNTLIDFQLKYKLISSRNDEQAGRYGPKTVTKLISIYGQDPLIKEDEKPYIIPINADLKKILAYSDVYLDGDKPDSSDVEKIQELFSSLGLYKGSIDGKYSSLKGPLLNFQKKIGIIKNEKSWGAGYYGNTTKEAIMKYYSDKDKHLVNDNSNIKNNNITLKDKDKKYLKVASNKINIYIKVKAKGDENKGQELKDKIIDDIEYITKKAKDEKTRLRLEYLSELIISHNLVAIN